MIVIRASLRKFARWSGGKITSANFQDTSRSPFIRLLVATGVDVVLIDQDKNPLNHPVTIIIIMVYTSSLSSLCSGRKQRGSVSGLAFFTKYYRSTVIRHNVQHLCSYCVISGLLRICSEAVKFG